MNQIRLVIALTVGAGCLPLAAQGFPGLLPKPSPAIPATPPTVAPPAPAPTPAQRPARRAEVTYTQGQLSVIADNASLNQILREIGRTTGIKITGGVAEERVYGTYGPSTASTVLDSLLDGTGSNVLLVQGEGGSPGELILTPRQGGVTPPNPNAPGFDDEGSGEEAPPPPQVQEGQRIVNQPTQQPSSAPSTPAGAPSAPATGTSPTDPNAVKTPQQIYEQLQRLRLQQSPPSQ